MYSEPGLAKFFTGDEFMIALICSSERLTLVGDVTTSAVVLDKIPVPEILPKQILEGTFFISVGAKHSEGTDRKDIKRIKTKNQKNIN